MDKNRIYLGRWNFILFVWVNGVFCNMKIIIIYDWIIVLLNWYKDLYNVIIVMFIFCWFWGFKLFSYRGWCLSWGYFLFFMFGFNFDLLISYI